MNVTSLSRHVRLAIRGEMLVAQAKLAFAARRMSILALGLLFAGLGLVFLNIGVFAMLGPLWGPVWTPVGLGLINLALAAVALLVAASAKPGHEVALAQEIRDMAGEQLQTEIASTPLLGSFASAGERPLAGLLLPALTSIIGALVKRRAEK